MFSVYVIFICLFFFQCNSRHRHTKAQFGVAGNCEMCKESIEEALKESPGIQSADWNVNTKMLTITYDSTVTNLNKIYKVVSTTGYDSDKMKGSDSAYSLLPHCCQYKRKAEF